MSLNPILVTGSIHHFRATDSDKTKIAHQENVLLLPTSGNGS